MFRSTQRWSALLATIVIGTLAACSSADAPSDHEPGPPPSDPVVYGASQETKDAVGVAKWGFEPFASDGSKVFRAYDEKNALLVEIRQRLEEREGAKTFTMTMTGKAASGSERIEYVAKWNEANTEVQWRSNVIENTFRSGTLAAKILARLSPDAAAVDVTPNGALTGGLTARMKPLDSQETVQGGESSLVEDDTKPLIECCCDLTEDTGKMAALAGSACALAEGGDEAIASGGNVTTQSFGADTAGAIRPRELVVGEDGRPQIRSPWVGPYHIVDNHCHDAAAANASATDGYIGCVPSSSTTSTSGHTINWAPDPTAGGAAGSYCAYEGQVNGGTEASNRVCCWSGGGVGDGGQPLLDTAAAQACVKQICGSQGSFEGDTPPVAFPAGQKPLVANDCASSTETAAACNTCCTTQADEVMRLFGKDNERYTQQVEEYRTRCGTACADADLVRQGGAQREAQQKMVNADAQGCLSSALGAKQSGAAAKQTCKDVEKK